MTIAWVSPAAVSGGKDNCCSGKANSRCTGATPCHACSNCSQCKYCNSGGTCGVCKKRASGGYSNSSKPAAGSQAGVAVQCKAITKKGTRCKRMARRNGYCWQHGG